MSLLSQLKFGLWNAARRVPVLSPPVQFLARLATRNLMRSHRRRMEENYPGIAPADRYERPLAVPTQVWIVEDPSAGDEARLGLRLLLNHLRIPYRRIGAANLRAADDKGLIQEESVFISARGAFPECFMSFGRFAYVMTFDEKRTRGPCPVIESQHAGGMEHIVIPLGAARLLPYRDGLCSEAARAVMDALFRVSRRTPLVTGMLPPAAALRIDDVAGEGTDSFLTAMLDHGWRPHLSVFVGEVDRAGDDLKNRLANLNREGRIGVDPHAFRADEFIYFDYPRARPYSREEFRSRWRRVGDWFEKTGFVLSPSVNPHFHVISPEALPILRDDGVRYLFSEVEPGTSSLRPSSRHWPSGDPVWSTGSADDAPLLQIYAGDSALDACQPGSLYDPFMHLPGRDAGNLLLDKVARKITMSSTCGFPCVLLMHERRLAGYPASWHGVFWEAVDDRLISSPLCSPAKVGLSELGAACREHLSVVIESVRNVAPGKWEVGMSGASSGGGTLSVFWQGSLTPAPVAPFAGRKVLEVTLPT